MSERPAEGVQKLLAYQHLALALCTHLCISSMTPDGQEDQRSVLKVEGLRRVIGDNIILAGISFEIQQGEVLFVTGKHANPASSLEHVISCPLWK